ncbi:MAG: hypothetical protein OEO21_08165 [Candidatus Krumholzibacteria bacterium]|nr:hypothetical protein [Candidatus Krumholzibacteria bacterium]
MRTPWFLAIAALGLAPAALAAQDVAELCGELQHRKPAVGSWAGYQMTGGKADGSQMRMAIVGSEAHGDSTFYWYEMAVESPKSETMVMQMLVPGIAYNMGRVRALVMKAGKEPAMKMPQQMVSMMASRMMPNLAAEIARNCLETEVLGWESVTVPAGSFRALHVRQKDQSEGWVTRDHMFGLVKAVTKDGATMELTGRGNDAKSSITETPRDMMGGP